MKKLLICLFLLFFVVACSKQAVIPETADMSGAMQTEQQQTVAVQQEVSPNTVIIQGFAFSPVALKIQKGTTVTWTNQDSVKHTVTSSEGSELDSKLLAKGESYSHTFNDAGTFAYYCKLHPNMKARVIVE